MAARASTWWWLRVAGSIAVVAILLTIIPLGEVIEAVRAVSPWVWGASVLVFVAGHAVNAAKLRLLIGTGAVTGEACLRAHFAAIAANLGLPGVAGGEVVRVSYLAPAAGTARVTMAALADRLIDFAVLCAIAGAAAATAGLPPTLSGGLRSGGRWVALGLATVAIGVVLVRRRFRRADPGRRLQAAWWSVLARPRSLAAAAALSAGVQTAFVLTNVWLGAQAGVTLGAAPWFLAWALSKVTVILPISLGGIGVREATLVSVLAAYGAPPDRVLAAGILWQGALITGSVLGFLGTQALGTRRP
jgi:uncharacterized membrane protein YbhN (UPF0104 family)